MAFVMGCNNTNKIQQVSDFSIQYLDIQDNKFIVNNDVTMRVEAPKASNVQLYMQDQGQERTEEVIEGKKSGNQWNFDYQNTHPFTKEVWIVAHYDEEKIVTEKKVITNQTQSYESMFESIIPITENFTNDFILSKQKINLNALGWIDEKRILAQEDNALISYHFDDNTKDILIEEGWNIYPNRNMEKVIYQDAKGLNIFDIKTKETKQIFKPKEHQLIKNLTWSRNNKEVILYTVENQKEEFYLINLQSGNRSTLNNIAKEGYTIEQLIYLNNGYLFALANIHAGTGDSGEEETTTGLLAINIYSGKIKNLTPQLQSMDEIGILSQVNENEFLVRLSSKFMSEEEIVSENNIYLLNTQSRKLKTVKSNIDFPYVYQLSHQKDSYIYLKNLDNDREQLDGKVIVFGEGASKEKEILKSAPYYPKTFYWSPGGERVLFYIDGTQELYCISKKS